MFLAYHYRNQGEILHIQIRLWKVIFASRSSFEHASMCLRIRKYMKKPVEILASKKW